MSVNAWEFRAQIEKQKSLWEKRSPTYGAIFAAVSSQLTGGGPAWFIKLESAWKDRAFATEYEAPFLLLDLIHYWALMDLAPELRRHFPDCGGKLTDAAPAEILAFLDRAPAGFWDQLGGLRLQTNEISRSAGWLLIACVGFGTRSTPFHLVDMGTSAGLNLIGDYLPRAWALKREDGETVEMPDHWTKIPYPVLSRIGLDGRPRNLSVREDRMWLKACIWPDESDRHARFDNAADLFVRVARDPHGPRLAECDFLRMPERAASEIKPHADEGLLLFNSQAVDFLTDREYAEFSRGIAKTLAPWEDRAFWVELELPRDKSSGFHQLTVHRLIDGKLEARILASMTTHPTDVRILPGWDFLRPLKPVIPQKNTREEPVNHLEPGLYKFPNN